MTEQQENPDLIIFVTRADGDNIAVELHTKKTVSTVEAVRLLMGLRHALEDQAVRLLENDPAALAEMEQSVIETSLPVNANVGKYSLN